MSRTVLTVLVLATAVVALPACGGTDHDGAAGRDKHAAVDIRIGAGAR